MIEDKTLHGGRTAGRERVLLGATILAPDGEHPVRVRDISSTGAQVVSRTPLPDGVDAIFKRGSVFVAARVVWVNGTEAGLMFYREID